MSHYYRNRFNKNYSRATRRIKSFDPSSLVQNNSFTQDKETEYVAVNSFTNLAISDILKKNILVKGYTKPTPIQDQVIPQILEGKDVIGIANTGTGKTAAFLIPLLNEVEKNRSKKVLIVAPTRELAVQIKNEFFAFSRGMNIYSSLCIGGVSIYGQKYELRRNPNFVIGTPGRIKDLVNQRGLNLSTFNIVVLDEVDQMLDFGFIGDIRYLISFLSKNRQSLFFSATIDARTKELLAGFVRNPVTVSVKKQDILKNIKHDIVRVSDRSRKIEQLHDLLIKKEFEKVLIFGRTKWGVQRLSDELVQRGFNADVIHGNKSQSQRLRILEKFKVNAIQILLATDVASRGLDIDKVSHVINYDPPESYETYIHRIGRTGRAEKPGTAITFV
ncbi:hypothetical protein A3A93_03170 [Candidatus Roizmanbacteria bacterium RIFCSPLOWO2_01_FULL_38_12]|uniref:RNA helicase n=1 Tax=Candidatus Roizmanbacteria bacterium RIFCSPLOWO2_01_FULL_38_12 TaxID=1802061 RepID=A0A1F7ISK7_9BACT|nr:MAG: hypothetical protein A2861_03835 [Candidatus Roizmanbacteria bacterium RIFCSPHIGHO2_01_FULL_38_15]OGK46349.1 MAG: hypothetical protein A3A93_03170 [Candidatus Roizmanbacteria bacterium RIFCSPLOWO2_01_FULL_38_12]